MNEYSRQLQDGIDEMEATIERLREEIKDLTEQRDGPQEEQSGALSKAHPARLLTGLIWDK